MDKQKLKIALVAQEYPPETARGGIGSQTFSKAHGLADFGHKVFVISRSTNQQRHEVSIGNITVIRIPGMENDIPDMTEIVQWITHSVVVAKEIDSLHAREGLDIVDFPEWSAEGYTFLLNRTAWNTIPTVIQLHGSLVMFSHVMNWPEIDSEFYKVGTHMEAICTTLADAIYSSSNCSAEWVKKYYGAEQKDIPVIHLGIDLQLFKPQAVVKNNYPTIVFIGKIVPNKGIEELTDAGIALYKEFPGIRLRIIGNGDEKYIASLKAKSIDGGAANLLDFAGYIQKEQLPIELARSHVFAMPSYYEGGPGFVFLEAMGCGLPVIGCSGSGVEEIITDQVNGIMVPPKDAAALEEALKKILQDRSFANSLGSAARKFVEAEADSRKCMLKLEAFYKKVIMETGHANQKPVN